MADDPQWLTDAIDAAYDGWTSRLYIQSRIRAALPAIRAGLADTLAATRARLLEEANSRMVWAQRIGETMDGLTYAEKIVRGQS